MNVPQTTQQSTQTKIYQHIQQTIKTISLFTTLFSLPLRSVEAADGLYFDSNNKFSLIVPPPHWSINDKKFALPSTGKYLSEEILFSAVNIQERCSMSVTKSDAKRLLKDFEIEYWFAPLETLQDVGTAELISQLLILQRDEAFESKSSASTLLSASFLPLPDKNALVFTYQAPIDDKKVRETIAKTIFQNGQLYTLWISSRPNVIAGEYGQSTLMTILQSFTVFP